MIPPGIVARTMYQNIFPSVDDFFVVTYSNPPFINCNQSLKKNNPIANNVDDQLKLNIQRVEHWISVGALPTPKVYFLLKKAGVRLHKEPVKKAEKKETPKVEKKAKAEAKAEVKAEVKNKKKVRTHNKKMKK